MFGDGPKTQNLKLFCFQQTPVDNPMPTTADTLTNKWCMGE